MTNEWTDWGNLERLEFSLEWPIREDRLGQLRQYAGRGRLSSTQRERHHHLLGLVAQHRPALDKLLESGVE